MTRPDGTWHPPPRSSHRTSGSRFGTDQRGPVTGNETTRVCSSELPRHISLEILGGAGDGKLVGEVGELPPWATAAMDEVSSCAERMASEAAAASMSFCACQLWGRERLKAGPLAAHETKEVPKKKCRPSGALMFQESSNIIKLYPISEGPAGPAAKRLITNYPWTLRSQADSSLKTILWTSKYFLRRYLDPPGTRAHPGPQSHRTSGSVRLEAKRDSKLRVQTPPFGEPAN